MFPVQPYEKQGICACGCGGTTAQSEHDNRARGIRAGGGFSRFIGGHHQTPFLRRRVKKRKFPVSHNRIPAWHYMGTMTLCIAAICREEKNKIVTVTDFLLSDKETSHEMRFLKVQRVGKTGKWLQLFAGDPSHFIAISDNARRKLIAAGSESFDDVVRAYQEAITEEKHKKIEDTVLSKYGLTLKKFIASGKRYFGKSLFAQLLNRIDDVTLSTAFLLAGFDENEPHLVSISDAGEEDDGERKISDVQNFEAIGEGARIADASLISTFDTFAPLEDVIYRLCEAKVRSHNAVPSVGERTYLTILSPEGKWTRIAPENVEGITKIIDKRINPPVPKSGRAKIIQIVGEHCQ